MEIALILYMCSAIQKTCLDPYVWPERFNDSYECMIQGYEESGKKIAEIGRKDVNEHDIYIKFECHKYKIILPPPKPEPETQSKVVI
jgi:hypothetical protein